MWDNGNNWNKTGVARLSRLVKMILVGRRFGLRRGAGADLADPNHSPR